MYQVFWWTFLGRKNPWVPIEKCETEIPIKKGPASPSINRTQFPSNSTVHRDDTLKVLAPNVRSISKHVDEIVSDERRMNNGIIGFTETKINLSDSTCKTIETLIFCQYWF